MGFGNAIVGGAAALIRAAIKSPNYSAGSAGWQVSKDGSAEFNNVTVRGTINGTLYVLNSSGAFFYSPSEASGNLIASIAAAAGTDSFGNSYSKGIQLGAASAGNQIQLIPGSAGGGTSGLQFIIGAASLANLPNLAAGTASGVAEMAISGPGLTTVGAKDWVQILTFANDGAGTAAHMDFRYVDTSGTVTVMATYNGTGWTFSGSTIALSASSLINFGVAAAMNWNESTQQLALPASGGPFISGEGFHAVSLATGLTGNFSGSVGVRVKKLPWNAIWIDVSVTMTGSTGGTFNLGSLPDATYYPTVGRQFPLSVTGAPSGIASSFPRIFVGTSGALQILLPSNGSTGTVASCSVMYPTN